MGQLKFGYKWSSPNGVEVRYVVLCCKVNSTLQIEDCQYTPARYLNCRYLGTVWMVGLELSSNEIAALPCQIQELPPR